MAERVYVLDTTSCEPLPPSVFEGASRIAELVMFVMGRMPAEEIDWDSLHERTAEFRRLRPSPEERRRRRDVIMTPHRRELLLGLGGAGKELLELIDSDLSHDEDGLVSLEEVYAGHAQRQ